jgi:hypothetical protein
MGTLSRSLSALSAFGALCSGLLLQQSITHGSLEGSRDIRRDSRPTWEQWRWASGWLDDKMFNDAAQSRRTSSAGFKECAHFSSPSANQFDTSLDLDVTYQKMSIADHIYFLCVQCDKKMFPMRWQGKVSMLDGLQADECLQQQNVLHYYKVTAMHKMVLWAAKEQHLRTAMVIEEDFTLPYMQHRNMNLNNTGLEEFINTGSWDFLRFGHMPFMRRVLDNDGKCQEQCLCVKEEMSADVCTTATGCDIRSSVAYMVAIRESLVDQFLEQTGVVDTNIFRAFKQSYIVPAIIHQSSEKWYYREVAEDASFREHCLRG